MDEENKLLHPSYLFIGPQAKLEQHAEQFIKNHLCPTLRSLYGNNRSHPSTLKPSSCSCISCKQIQQRQHHALVWINPSKDYTVDDIDIIFEKTKFSLDPSSKFFFILNNVHTLNQASANRLLKILEEPPAGYHFLLLTDNEEALLPTILSRCFIIHLQAAHEDQQHPLIAFFIDERKFVDPFGFEQTLYKNKLTDTESKILFEVIFNHYANQIKNHFLKKNILSEDKINYYHEVIAFLQEFMQKPPQSGSSAIFWKTVYLLFPKKGY